MKRPIYDPGRDDRRDDDDPGIALFRLVAVLMVAVVVAAVAYPAVAHWYACQQLAPLERLFVRGC
jgi:hypothetical protein